MNILYEGKAHKEDTLYFNCDFCGSKLRAIKGDPRVNYSWNGHNDIEWDIRTVCPVCKMQIKTHSTKFERQEILTIQDKEEMKSWVTDLLEDLTDDDLIFIDTSMCEKRYRDRHSKDSYKEI